MATYDKSDTYLLQFILDKIDGLQSLLHKRKKPFLTIQEASEYLNISKNTLYGYTSKGILPFYKLRNRKVYFRISDLNRFVVSPQNRVEDYLEEFNRDRRKENKISEFDEFVLPTKKRRFN